MKKIIVTLVLLLFCILGIQAQSNTVSLGGEASGSGGSATFTSGETFYEYKEGATASLVEGVQQGVLYEFSRQPSSTTICATIGSTASLSAAFNNLVSGYTWQYKASTSNVWTTINSFNAGTVYSNYTTATLAITRSTTLPATATQYRVIANSAIGDSASNEVALTVIPTAVAGTIATNTASVCLGSSITYSLSGYVGSSIQWQSLTSSNAVTGTVVGTGDTYTAFNASGTSQYVRALVTNGTCSTATSAIKTITVNRASVGGTITGGGVVCSGATGLVKVSGYTGSVLLWEYSTDGVNYVAVPTLVGTAAATFTSNTISNTTASYSFTNITGTTYFRFKSKNGVCDAASSNVVQYTIIPTATAGTVSGLSTLCTGTGTTLTLVNAVGTIAWQKSTNWTAATPTWTAVSGTSTSLATGSLSLSTAFRAVVTTGTCSTSAATTSNFVVTVNKNAVAGTITTNTASVCLGGSITYTLSGYVGSAIQWQSLSSATATSGTVVGTGASYTANNASGTFQYVRAVVTIGTCSTVTTAIKTTTVNPTSVGGTITGGGTVYSGASGLLKVRGYTGSVIVWEYSTDGVNFAAVPTLVGNAAATFVSNTISNSTASYSFTNITGTTYFRFKSKNGICDTAYSNVVQYSIIPNASTISITGLSTVCSGTGTTLTLVNAVGTIVWQKTTNWTSATPIWTAVSGTTTSLATGNLSVSTAYRAIVTSGACASSAATTSDFVVSVSPTAVAGTITTNTASVCLGGSVTYTLSGYVGSAIQWQSLSSATATTGTVVGTGANYTANNASGTFQYVRAVVTSGSCTTATSAVKTLTVNPASVGGTIITGGGAVCLGASGLLKISGYTGSVIVWEYSTDGVNYVAVPALVGTAAITFTSNTISNSTASYLFTNITGTTYFRFKSSNGICNAAYSNVVQYSIIPTAIAGTVTGLSSVCTGTGTTLTLENSIGTIVWQKSTNWTASTPTWKTVTGATTSILATGNLTTSSAYRAVVTSGTCVTSAATTTNFIVNVSSCTAKSELAENPFAVVANPNPFSDNFKMDFTSSSEDKVSILVYDMIGKLLEKREVQSSEMNTEEIGNSYPSGVYNVIVTQGENIKTLRVIKR
jgi:hypothetical protein